MRSVKDHLIATLLIIAFLLVIFALDDSYEDSILSAQVLDEAIAQAYEDKETVIHVVQAQQAKADF